MKLVIQRVAWAEVCVDSRTLGRIEKGLLVYVGVAAGDTLAQAQWSAAKIATLRIFQDHQGKMNLALDDVGGSVLAVPNFTLLGDARKGRRPAFVDAAEPRIGSELFDAFVASLRQAAVTVETGRFGANMIIESAADGPVNLVLDSPSQ